MDECKTLCGGGDRAYLADLTDRAPNSRGTIVGAQSAVHALGLVIGPLIGGRAAEQYGAPAAFYLAGGVLRTSTRQAFIILHLLCTSV